MEIHQWQENASQRSVSSSCNRKESAWTGIADKVTKYIIDTFANDGGKRLKDSKIHDGYGRTYFFEDKLQTTKYTYFSEYNLSVYKCGGVNVTLAMVNEICKLYTINPDRVWLLLVV